MVYALHIAVKSKGFGKHSDCHALSVFTFYPWKCFFFLQKYDLFHQILIISRKVTTLSYNEDATKCQSAPAGVVPPP